MIKKYNKKIKVLLNISIIFITLFFFAPTSQAMTEVYFQKDSKEIIKGDTFLVNLKISSEKIMNVVDGTITYDKDKLEIREVKINNSLLSLWTKEPIFNNEIGELSFTGGTPDGFNGKDGQILEITFFAKKEGLSLVGFKDIFSVFISDGKGTKINPWLKPISLSINQPPNFFIYVGVFILILLFIIINLFIRKKNDK